MNSMSAVWIPAFGTLCIRTVSTIVDTNLELCFRDIESDEIHYRYLLRIHNWLTKIHRNGFVDTNRAQMSTRMDEKCIVRREASDDDVALFFKLWDEHMSIQTWLEQLTRSAECPAEVLVRLQRCYSERD